MERSDLTDDDKGKRVVNYNGDKVGVVSGIDGDDAHVAPDAGLSDSTRSKLGWSDKEESDYVLPSERVDTISDDEIRLKDDD